MENIKRKAETMNGAEDNKTIRPRLFSLSLSDNDMDAFFQKAYRNGTTPQEVLEGFICDLIDGTQTRGSDERELAQMYFARCLYTSYGDSSFLPWVIGTGAIKELEEDLAGLEHDDREEREFAQDDIERIYTEYLDSTKDAYNLESKQEALQSVRDYLKKRNEASQ